MTVTDDALTRLQGGYYNSAAYHAVTNPGGMDESVDGLTSGHINNFPSALTDVGLAAAYAGQQAAAAAGLAGAAANHAVVATNHATTVAGHAATIAGQAQQAAADAATIAASASTIASQKQQVSADAAAVASHAAVITGQAQQVSSDAADAGAARIACQAVVGGLDAAAATAQGLLNLLSGSLGLATEAGDALLTEAGDPLAVDFPLPPYLI